MNSTSIYMYFYCGILSFIIFYILAISSYAVDFIIIKKKTDFWCKASDDEVIQKVLNIMCNYDKNICLNLINKQMFIKKVEFLNRTNMKFKIACYREGVKQRLNEIINKEKDI